MASQASPTGIIFQCQSLPAPSSSTVFLTLSRVFLLTSRGPPGDPQGDRHILTSLRSVKLISGPFKPIHQFTPHSTLEHHPLLPLNPVALVDATATSNVLPIQTLTILYFPKHQPVMSSSCSIVPNIHNGLHLLAPSPSFDFLTVGTFLLAWSSKQGTTTGAFLPLVIFNHCSRYHSWRLHESSRSVHTFLTGSLPTQSH
jgi:hypothetical protein